MKKRGRERKHLTNRKTRRVPIINHGGKNMWNELFKVIKKTDSVFIKVIPQKLRNTKDSIRQIKSEDHHL